MRRIIVKEVRPGMCVARAAADPRRLEGPPDPGVPTRDVLTMAQIVPMPEVGVYHQWVIDPGLEFFDEVCASQPTTAQLRLAEGLRDAFLKLTASIPISVFRRYEIVLSE